MSSMREMFTTNTSDEKDGVWIDYGSFRIRIARAGGSNKKFQKSLEEHSRPHRRAIDLGIMDNDMAEDMLRKVYAETVVRGWETKVDGEWEKGIEGEDGELIPPTVDNILATFRELPDLFDDLKSQASQVSLFRAANREEASGN